MRKLLAVFYFAAFIGRALDPLFAIGKRSIRGSLGAILPIKRVLRNCCRCTAHRTRATKQMHFCTQLLSMLDERNAFAGMLHYCGNRGLSATSNFESQSTFLLADAECQFGLIVRRDILIPTYLILIYFDHSYVYKITN